MKTGAVIVSVAIATLIGYFVGVSRRGGVEAPASLSTSHVEAPALAREFISSSTSTTSDTSRPLATQNPKTAIEEEMEAMRNGDVSAVAKHIVFSPEAKVLMESVVASAPAELVRQYPTPELLAAFIFCGAQRIEGFRIESTSFERPDLALLRIAYKFASEPEWRRDQIALGRMPDGWHRVIGISEARRVAGIVGFRKR